MTRCLLHFIVLCCVLTISQMFPALLMVTVRFIKSPVTPDRESRWKSLNMIWIKVRNLPRLCLRVCLPPAKTTFKCLFAPQKTTILYISCKLAGNSTYRECLRTGQLSVTSALTKVSGFLSLLIIINLFIHVAVKTRTRHWHIILFTHLAAYGSTLAFVRSHVSGNLMNVCPTFTLH